MGGWWRGTTPLRTKQTAWSLSLAALTSATASVGPDTVAFHDSPPSPADGRSALRDHKWLSTSGAGEEEPHGVQK